MQTQVPSRLSFPQLFLCTLIWSWKCLQRLLKPLVPPTTRCSWKSILNFSMQHRFTASIRTAQMYSPFDPLEYSYCCVQDCECYFDGPLFGGDCSCQLDTAFPWTATATFDNLRDRTSLATTRVTHQHPSLFGSHQPM